MMYLLESAVVGELEKAPCASVDKGLDTSEAMS